MNMSKVVDMLTQIKEKINGFFCRQRQDHRQQVRSRRVSFAPAANLRYYNNVHSM